MHNDMLFYTRSYNNDWPSRDCGDISEHEIKSTEIFSNQDCIVLFLTRSIISFWVLYALNELGTINARISVQSFAKKNKKKGKIPKQISN